MMLINIQVEYYIVEISFVMNQMLAFEITQWKKFADRRCRGFISSNREGLNLWKHKKFLWLVYFILQT